ncbi:DUF2971 domain-containing protein [Gordonia sp. OPL2]|nr:DUF2971 domain-containing protein [Gordonia sp. OPL2]
MHSSWGGEIELGGSLNLRASDVRYLNDTTEVRYGAKVVAKILRNKSKSTDISDVERHGLLQLADELKNDEITIDWWTHRSPVAVHAACFTESGDLLSQWQGYGDNGGGYAIGVTRDALQYSLVSLPGNPMFRGLQLKKVCYGNGQKTKSLVANLIETLTGEENVLDKGELSDTARRDAIMTAAQIKHPAFKSEREWRLITDTSGNWFNEFRPTSQGLIPYVDYIVNPTPTTTPLHPSDLASDDGPAPRPPTIGKVVVGPGGDRKLRMDAVSRLLRRFGHNPDCVVQSDVPYRA